MREESDVVELSPSRLEEQSSFVPTFIKQALVELSAGKAVSPDSLRHGYAVPPPSAGRLLVVFQD